ncbi:MAG TPA: ATP-binding protein [Methyloceanibacter sp.]|nr:ATP-binding protein [Methyloceanibacter sp.]
MLQKLWYDRPVRTQLLVAVGVINLLAAILAGAVSILNTRTATKVEIEASLEVAQRFVAATMKDLAAQGRLGELNQQLPLQLKHLRHVRIMFMDQIGQLTVVSPQPSEVAGAPDHAPTWFARLVRPQLVGRAVRIVAIDHSTPVVIVGEPADEIAEAWHDFSSLALVWLVLNALILAILYVVLGRVLDPLAHLSKGMLSLEDGHYATRLELPKVKELAVLTERFNTLAGALDTARDENSRLYRQLITVQEEERRQIANELHDEAGPCLFGITANASSIQNFADQLPDDRQAEMITRRVGEILSIAERLKLLNRALLKKLRPGPLGRVKLSELLDELVAGFQRRHPDTHISIAFGKLADSYGEAIDLTLYRCIQEGITNAIRHGKAGSLAIDLLEESTRKNGSKRFRGRVSLTLSDDGKGIAPATPKGFGLTTMTERVRSLGGTCEIESAPAKGTIIHVEIPIERASTTVTSAPEFVGGLS